MKCGVAEGWQYPSTRGNLLTAGARWRYSLAQERSAHSDTTASVCAPGSLAVIYDASRAITLSLTLIQQFIYWCACIWAEVSFLQGGGHNKRLPSASATSIVSQETSHVTWFIGGNPDEAWFLLTWWHMEKCLSDATESSRNERQQCYIIVTCAEAGGVALDFFFNKVMKVSSWLRCKAASAKPTSYHTSTFDLILSLTPSIRVHRVWEVAVWNIRPCKQFVPYSAPIKYMT